MTMVRSVKNNISLTLLLLIILVVSCKKENGGQHSQPTPPPTINAKFIIERKCFNINLLLLKNSQFIDSSIIFVNKSDTGTKVSYRWNFGDNTFSTQKDVSHTYLLPGTYKVQSITYYDRLPSDTAEESINLLIGQQKFISSKDIEVIDGAMTTDDGVLAILGEFDGYNYHFTYSLLCTDSLLKPKWRRDVGYTNRLSSIQRISGNEYILSGNYLTGNTGQFAISRLNSTGDHIWTKFIANLQGHNISTIETADNGFITIGSSGTIPSYVAVVKLDMNGNEVWRKLFNNASYGNNLKNANSIIESNNNYILGAINDAGSYQSGPIQ